MSSPLATRANYLQKTDASLSSSPASLTSLEPTHRLSWLRDLRIEPSGQGGWVGGYPSTEMVASAEPRGTIQRGMNIGPSVLGWTAARRAEAGKYGMSYLIRIRGASVFVGQLPIVAAGRHYYSDLEGCHRPVWQRAQRSRSAVTL
jgi:hypothetical protein